MSALSISPFRLASGDKVIIEVAAQNGVGIGEQSLRVLKECPKVRAVGALNSYILEFIQKLA